MSFGSGVSKKRSEADLRLDDTANLRDCDMRCWLSEDYADRAKSAFRQPKLIRLGLNRHEIRIVAFRHGALEPTARGSVRTLDTD
jgi:hypothetical protein